MLFKDKTAIVTGASRGIGKAIALMLSKEGANVAFNYLKSKGEADSLKEQIEKTGGKALSLQLDIREFDKAKELIEKTKARFGGLDILVNNAGITIDKALMMMAPDDWKQVVDTNLGGVFNVTRNAIITFLKQKKGDIVNVSSVSGVIGLPRQTNYSASKAGIIGFTKALAKEVAAYNIRVNAVAPGFIKTDMVAGIKEEHKEEIIKHIPLARFGEVEDVAKAVKFLLSKDASFITGQTIIIDGGLSIN
ncbi:MAG: 3-oxoacyl-[acyl-carrier-protein] reductase [Candidatus Omnitrophica bacterium]|jgi:3-oxoacyl-[acyl-carrier protein] reductase|nr:3-oxoacyl-[acyl-carrier-protein] reductase [Candidatus Omnitrophota bacterium]